MITLYLATREMIHRMGSVEPLRGVLYADPKFASGFRIFGQLTLTFRYGRDDEEVMGLRFCNEAIIALKQICPKVETDGDPKEDLTPLQVIVYTFILAIITKHISCNTALTKIPHFCLPSTPALSFIILLFPIPLTSPVSPVTHFVTIFFHISQKYHGLKRKKNRVEIIKEALNF